MKISLLVKYAVSYLAVVIASLIVMNTIGTARVLKGITSDRVNAMSKEGNVIVESYMDDYYKGGTTLSEVYKELQTIDTFSDARIMIVNPDGEILSDTRGYASAEKADSMAISMMAILLIFRLVWLFIKELYNKIILQLLVVFGVCIIRVLFIFIRAGWRLAFFHHDVEKEVGAVRQDV